MNRAKAARWNGTTYTSVLDLWRSQYTESPGLPAYLYSNPVTMVQIVQRVQRVQLHEKTAGQVQ